jgi:hypothetical protein
LPALIAGQPKYITKILSRHDDRPQRGKMHIPPIART